PSSTLFPYTTLFRSPEINVAEWFPFGHRDDVLRKWPQILYGTSHPQSRFDEIFVLIPENFRIHVAPPDTKIRGSFVRSFQWFVGQTRHRSLIQSPVFDN